MNTKGQENKNHFPTLTEIKMAKKNLEIMLKSAESSNESNEYHLLLKEIGVFINLCQPLFDSPNSRNTQKNNYAQSTLNQIEKWIDEWEGIALTVLRKKLNQGRGIKVLLSSAGRLFQLRSRAEYSDRDLPKLQPADYSTTSSLRMFNLIRDYNDNDLPQYLSD